MRGTCKAHVWHVQGRRVTRVRPTPACKSLTYVTPSQVVEHAREAQLGTHTRRMATDQFGACLRHQQLPQAPAYP